MFCFYFLVKEDGGRFAEFLARFGCVVPACAAFGELLLFFGVATEVVCQTFCDVFALRYDSDAGGCVLLDFR